MNKPTQLHNENILSRGIHQTPTTGLGHKTKGLNCNQSIHVARKFKALQVITALHCGEVNENQTNCGSSTACACNFS